MSVSVEPQPKRITIIARRGSITVPIPYELLAKHSKILKMLCIELGSSRSWCEDDPWVRDEVRRVVKKLGYIVSVWCRETPAGLECENDLGW
jgi:hypothetical protein